MSAKKSEKCKKREEKREKREKKTEKKNREESHTGPFEPSLELKKPRCNSIEMRPKCSQKEPERSPKGGRKEGGGSRSHLQHQHALLLLNHADVARA